MHSDVIVPTLPESTQSAEITKIHVNEGQQVDVGDVLFDVETDKVVLEVVADHSGVIEKITISTGHEVSSEQVVMILKESEVKETPKRQGNVEYIEVITEKLVKDDSGRVLLEEVVGNSLFDKRGIICGVVGLIIGLAVGVLGTAIIIG